MKENERSENFIKIDRQRTKDESQKIINCLRNHFIFYNLTQPQIENVQAHMSMCTVDQNEYLYKQGSRGMSYFLLEKGLIELQAKDQLPSLVKPHQGFGQVALLYDTPRKTSAKALEPLLLYFISRPTFRNAVYQILSAEYQENKRLLQSTLYYSLLQRNQKDIIASKVVRHRYKKHTTIFYQKDPGSTMYYILQGVISLKKGNEVIKTMSKGDSLGQQSLYYNTMRLYSAVVQSDAQCIVLERDLIREVVGDKTHAKAFTRLIRDVLMKNEIICRLPDAIITNIVQGMKINVYGKHQIVYRKGLRGVNKIVVVIDSNLQQKDGGNVVEKFHSFGEQILLANCYVLQEDIVMAAAGVVAEIDEDGVEKAMEGKKYKDIVEEMREKSKKYRDTVEEMKESNVESKQYLNRIEKFKYDKINIIKSMTVLSKLENPEQFGSQYIVMSRQKHQYVLKVTSKKQLQQFKVQKYYNNSVTIRNSLHHKLIIPLFSTFQSPNYLFELTPYLHTASFSQFLLQKGILSPQDTKHYASYMILLLKYLQEVDIILRDLKPQNFVMSPNNELWLREMPIAVHGPRTNTVIGSPHYMAPEMISGVQYDRKVDLWALGVCIYELMCGMLPFGDSSTTPLQIYEDVVQSNLSFPPSCKDRKAMALVSQLLDHSPNKRGNIEEIMQHPWYYQYQWNKHISVPRKEKDKIDITIGIDGGRFVEDMERMEEKRTYIYEWRDFGESIEF